MDDIKNTILKTNKTGKLTTTTTKFANLIKVDKGCVFNILNDLKSQAFLNYTLSDDALAIQIINQEGFKYECQRVIKSNVIICIYCQNKTSTRYSSEVVNGIKYKRASCYCIKTNGPIWEKKQCNNFISKFLS
jgi:hypothetical protein